MALIKFGSIITDARGAIAGHQIRAVRSGRVLSAKQNSAGGQTSAQTLQRAYLATSLRSWTADLTQSDRDDWSTLAATVNETDPWGDTYAMTGVTLFSRVNAKRLRAGLSIIVTAPTDQVVTAPLTAALTAPGGNTLSIAYTATPAPANHSVKIYATPPRPLGVSAVQHRYRLIVISAAAEASPIDFTADYEAIFGALPANKRVFAQITFWNRINGAEAAPLSTSVDL